ncbi:MAG: diaminopimelate decarboxylase [Spirochaetales bacterium]|jgi:diaminopimelate decarboxylase|nr:diaminopimelate decarboxylase [Spirochaetales bacterium]
MSLKTLPFTPARIEDIALEYSTPFHIYDEKAIRENARAFYRAFDWVPGGFINYFAVKALPNPHILKILREEGMGADCSSLPELLLARAAGIKPEHIIFTSNDTPAGEFIRARKMGVVINLDDISHIPFLEKAAGLPAILCCRYNPGPLKGGNAIIGKPEEAKYGFTGEQLFEAYGMLKQKGLTRFGLHAMVASNELRGDYFIETAALLFHLAAEINRRTGVRFEFINLGGGVGIPYRPDQDPVDLVSLSRGIRRLYEEIIVPAKLDPLGITMECGRMVTGPYGYLVSRVLHKKQTYKTYVGLDACMANLMRPALYGAYHHISVPGREEGPREKADVTGSLCENNDKFAIDRELPVTSPGDLVVIHDTGAHGHAMGFNYNGKLRSAELLLTPSGKVRIIRRAETLEDYFATLDSRWGLVPRPRDGGGD